MFSGLAPAYRRFNRWASLGQDFRWRRALIGQLEGAGDVLDIGTGTGELAAALQRPGRRVVGADVSPGMLAEARRRPGEWVGASADRLPFPPESFDAVVSAFVLRNLHQGGIIQGALEEAARVLKTGGRLVFLDLTRPRARLLRWGHGIYNRTVLPLIGRALFGSRWPGGYLAGSIGALPEEKLLAPLFLAAGFRSLEVKPLSGGIVSLFIGRR